MSNQNKLISILTLLLCLSVGTLKAQCSFTPTVTPNNLILCPNATDTLWTQPYDSYQWFKGGVPIPGATQQYYVVNYFADAGDYFKVSATVGTCTELAD